MTRRAGWPPNNPGGSWRALERPGVLVGDDDRDAAQPADRRGPHVRAELVGVQDVDALASQQAGELHPRREVAAPAALQRDDVDARRLELRGEARIGRAAREAQPRLEPGAV